MLHCLTIVDDIILPAFVAEVKVLNREHGERPSLSIARVSITKGLICKCHEARGIPHCSPDTTYSNDVMVTTIHLIAVYNYLLY